jgi:hypothetical protein
LCDVGLAQQIDELKKANCFLLLHDEQSLFAQLKSGDLLVITSTKIVSEGCKELLSFVIDHDNQNVGFKVLDNEVLDSI